MTANGDKQKPVKRRKAVPALASRKAYQEADNRCPFCGVGDVAVLEIHHLDGNPSETLLTDRGLLVAVTLWVLYCGFVIYRGTLAP